MMEIRIEGIENLNQRLRDAEKACQMTAKRAVSKTATSVRAEWARAVSKEIALGVGMIKDAIKVRKEGGGEALIIRVDSRGSKKLGTKRSARAIPIQTFKPRQTKTGVSVRIKKSAGRKKIKSAFITAMPGGHRGVFTRAKNAKRLPVKELFTTAVEDVASDTLPDMKQFAARRLNEIFERQLDYELRRRGLLD